MWPLILSCLKRPRGQKLRAKPAANILKSNLIRFAGLILCESRKLNFKLLGMLIVDLTHYSKMEKIPSLTAQVSVHAKSRLFNLNKNFPGQLFLHNVNFVPVVSKNTIILVDISKRL